MLILQTLEFHANSAAKRKLLEIKFGYDRGIAILSFAKWCQSCIFGEFERDLAETNFSLANGVGTRIGTFPIFIERCNYLETQFFKNQISRK